MSGPVPPRPPFANIPERAPYFLSSSPNPAQSSSQNGPRCTMKGKSSPTTRPTSRPPNGPRSLAKECAALIPLCGPRSSSAHGQQKSAAQLLSAQGGGQCAAQGHAPFTNLCGPSHFGAAILTSVRPGGGGMGKDQLVHHISTFQIERTKTSATSLDLWLWIGDCQQTKSAKSTESQEFLHTCSRKVTLKPTSIPPTETIQNALSVHDSNENEVSSNAHCIRNTQRQQNEMRPLRHHHLPTQKQVRPNSLCGIFFYAAPRFGPDLVQIWCTVGALRPGKWPV